MDQVRVKIEELRGRYETLREERTPIDVFAFFEIDLGLDPIPFDDLTAKYRVEAAITADFTGIYLDAEQYALMEKGPVWKLNRLRFTVAHELAHYFLHQDLPQPKHFASLPVFARGLKAMGVGNTRPNRKPTNSRAGCLSPSGGCRPASMSSRPKRKSLFITSWPAARSGTNLRRKSPRSLA